MVISLGLQALRALALNAENPPIYCGVLGGKFARLPHPHHIDSDCNPVFCEYLFFTYANLSLISQPTQGPRPFLAEVCPGHCTCLVPSQAPQPKVPSGP